MSKLMADLNKLNDSRKMHGGIIIEDAPKNEEKVPVVHGRKSFYFSSFLVIVLIAFSALSMSISLKTFTQLEDSWTNASIIFETLHKQGNDVEILRSLVADNTLAEIARVDQLNNRITKLKKTISRREKELLDIKVTAHSLTSSMQDSIAELQISDKLILNKFNSLDEKIENSMNFNSTILSAY